MKQYWWIFEICVNLFQGLTMAYFVYAHLGDRKGRSFLKSYGVIYGLMVAVMITLFNYLIIYEHVYALLYSGILFVYAIKHLKQRLLAKLFSVVFINVLLACVSAMVTYSASFILAVEAEDVFSKPSIRRLLIIVMVQMIWWLLIKVSLKILKMSTAKTSIHAAQWVAVVVVVLVSFMIAVLLNQMALDQLTHNISIYTALIAVGIGFVCIGACYVIVALGNRQAMLRENELLKMKDEHRQQYAAQMKSEYENSRQLRHDLKDQYFVLDELMKRGKHEQAHCYLKQFLGELTQSEIMVQTNHEIVNILINMKLSEAKRQGVLVSCLSVVSFDGVQEVDLCRLLSNMLDNAITAAKQCQTRVPQLQLVIEDAPYQYSILVKNTIEQSVLEQNSQLHTTKKSSTEHGMGTKIIQQIAQRYYGRSDFYEDEHDFCCLVMLQKHPDDLIGEENGVSGDKK